MKKFFCLMAALAFFMPALAAAVTLNVGTASGVNSFDPHFHNETPTNSANYNIFDGLVNFDEELNPFPVLAESWKTLNDTIWEFKLRQGVKFQNGNAFNADDVVWSFNRARTGEKSGFKAAMSAIKTVEKVDDYTVRVITNKPYPVLLRKLSYLRIMEGEGSLFAEIPRDDSDQSLTTIEGRYVGRIRRLRNTRVAAWVQQFYDSEEIVKVSDVSLAALADALRKHEGGALKLATDDGSVRLAAGDRVRLVATQPDATVQLGKTSYRGEQERTLPWQQ